MNYSPAPCSYTASQGWDTSVEMLASSMMLVSIAENQSADVGYNASPPSERTNSGLSHGWGSSLSRKSFKTNLCDLADSGMESSAFHPGKAQTDAFSGEWGHYADSNAR
jgi:hypothetical protein